MRGRDQTVQHRPDPFRVDREFDRVVVAGRRRGALAWRKLEQLVGVDGDRVGVDRGRGRDGGRDDIGLGGQALHPRRDNVGAELVEEQKADRQDHEAAEIEDDDAAGQRR